MLEKTDHHISLKRFSKVMRRKSDWMKDALCATAQYRDLPWLPAEDATTIFKRRSRNALAQICNQCPVRAECRTFAKEAGVTAGVWAGRYYGG